MWVHMQVRDYFRAYRKDKKEEKQRALGGPSLNAHGAGVRGAIGVRTSGFACSHACMHAFTVSAGQDVWRCSAPALMGVLSYSCWGWSSSTAGCA